MKVFIVFAAVLLVASAADEEACYTKTQKACTEQTPFKELLLSCNAKYGAIDTILPDLQTYANTHIVRSFEYLLMSTHFANFEKNRAGFAKVLRKLSDSTWEDAINLIKYTTKRGGKHSFNQRKTSGVVGLYELNEIQSLAKAVDMEKNLATDGFHIHERVTKTDSKRGHRHDTETAHFIEEEFAEKHSGIIRELSGHVSDLSKLLNSNDHALALFMFDEYLQK